MAAASPDPLPSPAGSAVTVNLSAESLALFERSWQSYHRVVSDDLMEHAGLLQGLAGCLADFLAGCGAQPLTMADLAYGDQGSGDVITPGSALSFVVDIVAVVPATDITGKPDVSVEGAENVTELETVDLVDGDGAVAETGMTVAFHLVAFRGDTGEELDETWSTGEPVTTTLVEGGAIAGLVDGITGMKVGGRREIPIPYADAFGDAGQSDLGLPEKTDLVVVVDLLATF